MMKLDLQLFGASVSITGSDVDTDITSNTSYITGTITIYTNGSTYNNSGDAYYTINGGGRNYFRIGRNSSFTASYRLGAYGHNNDGSLGNQTVSVYVHVTNTTSTSNSISVPMQTISRWATMTSATNFNDEQNPTFTYSNPALTPLSVWLEPNPVGEHLCIRDNIPNTQGSYTWTITDSEREQLRAKCPNSNNCTIRIGMYSNLNGNIRASYIDKTFSIVNANPTFSTFTFEDTNEKTLALTGNSQNMITGYSTVKVTIPNISKGVAKKETTMRKYRFTIGNSSVDIPYSDTEDVTGSIANASTGVYNVYAIDSRNNSTLATKNANNIISYSPIKITNMSLARESGVSGNVTLSLSGTFWNGDFGKSINSIKEVTYVVHNNDTNTDTTKTLDISKITVNENNFSYNGLIAGDQEDTTFNIDSSYSVTITMSDELSSSKQNTIVASGIPAISIAKSGVGIFCKYDSSIGGYLQVNGNIVEGNSSKVLFSDSSGVTETATFYEDISKYKYLEIFYKDNDGRCASTKMEVAEGKMVVLLSCNIPNSISYLKFAAYQLNVANKRLSRINCAEAAMDNANSQRVYSADVIFIQTIVGYK